MCIHVYTYTHIPILVFIFVFVRLFLCLCAVVFMLVYIYIYQVHISIYNIHNICIHMYLSIYLYSVKVVFRFYLTPRHRGRGGEERAACLRGASPLLLNLPETHFSLIKAYIYIYIYCMYLVTPPTPRKPPLQTLHLSIETPFFSESNFGAVSTKFKHKCKTQKIQKPKIPKIPKS